MRIALFANGEHQPGDKDQEIFLQADLIIAADGGANHCNSLQIQPDLVVGDLDSIDPALLASYTRKDIAIKKYPAAKDKADLELAIDHGLALGAKKIHIFGALGGRWDMSLANILLLASPSYRQLELSLSYGNSFMRMLWPGTTEIAGEPGQRVSLLALGQDAKEVSLSGFLYPLQSGKISFASSLGVSNVLVKEKAQISFSTGTLLLVFS